jgi:DNA-directed RNA polymerase subunit beta
MLVKEGDELTEEVYNRLRRQGIETVKVFASYMTIDPARRDGRDRARRARDASDDRRRRRHADGEVIAETGQSLTDALIKKIRKAEIIKVKVFVTSGRAESTMVKNTLAKDPTARYYKKEGGEQKEYAVDSKMGEELALKQIYGLLRPGDAPDTLTAKQALERLFFSPKRYDLGRVGRYKINQRLGLNTPADLTVLTKDDFVEIVRYLVELHEGRGHVDDIDHLGNRRIRSVGELIANQFSVGLSRMARLGQGAHVDQHRSGEDLARRSGERAYGERGHPGVLRLVAAVAVHGSDQPPRRADAQASSLGARTGRSDA